MLSLRLLTICALIGLIVAVPQLSRKQQAQENSRRKNARPAEPQPADDDDTTDQCPEPNGYFADAEQCDKYYDCRDGAITEKLCPDGMVFNDYSSEYEKCDLPFNIDCKSRPKLQTPKPSLHCRRQNGYFSHEEPHVCDKFYFCVDGTFNMITCPDGLVYNEKTGICTWPDEAKRGGCSSKELFQGFTCPQVNESIAITHPRYADPEDCQYFYVCVNGDSPRRNGCKLGQVFDDVNKKCEWARKVPECANWYKGQLTDEELDALENPPTTAKPQPGGSQRRKKPHRPSSRVVVEE